MIKFELFLRILTEGFANTQNSGVLNVMKRYWKVKHRAANTCEELTSNKQQNIGKSSESLRLILKLDFCTEEQIQESE